MHTYNRSNDGNNNRNIMNHLNGYDFNYSGCESPAPSSTSSSKTRRNKKRTYYHCDDEPDDYEFKKKRKQAILCESLKAEIADEPDTIEEILDTRIGQVGHTGDMTTIYNYQPELMPDTKSTERQYLIKWKNWSHVHATWESEESLKERQCVEGMKKLERYIIQLRETERYKNSCTRDELEKLLFYEERKRELNYQKMQCERIIHEQYDTTGNKEYFIKWKSLDYRYVTAEESETVVKKLFSNSIHEFYLQNNKERCPDVDTPYLRRRPVFRPLPENTTFGYHDTVLKLRDYQLIGLNWLLKLWTLGRNAILADEMGLGKTIQTVTFISVLFRRYKIYGPYLIIVPLSTINNWKKEFDVWAPEVYTVVYTGDIQSREIIKKYELFLQNTRSLKFNVMLTTYEIAMNDKTLLSSIYWVFLGVDEAHRLKSSESKLYKTIFPLRTNCRLLITGTPLQNNIRELWSLLHFILPKDFEYFNDFEQRFGTAETEQLCNDKLANLREAIQPFILRREKKDVEKSLPAKSEQILRINMSQKQKELYRLILAKNFESLLAETNKNTIFKNVIVELKKCCNHVELISEKMAIIPTLEERKEYLIRSSGKMIVLDKLLSHLKDEHHRVLIFSQMVKMLDILDDYLRLKGWGFQRLDGSVSSNLRNEAINNFNSAQSTDFCFLLSTRAGGLGINLTTADTVIIFDSDWNPHADMQAMARAHRIGQTKQVSIYRFVIKSSVEEKIIERAKQKMVLDHLVIQRMEADGKSINGTKPKSTLETEDFEKILRFSAQEIFRDGDDDQDFNLQTILKQAEVQNTEQNNSATSAFLSSFKVISLDTDSLDNINSGAEIATEAEAKSWNELIPKKYIDTINKNSGKLGDIIDEIGDQKSKELNSSSSSSGIKRESKNSRNKNNTLNESKSSTSKSSSSTNSGQLVKLNRLDTRKLVQAIQKFGCPHQRAQKIINETQLTKLTENDAVKLIVDIIDKSKKYYNGWKQSDGPCFMNYNTYQFDAKYLVGRLELLEELHAVMVIYKSKERLHHQFLESTKPTAWSCPWDTRDDNHLLVGVYEHGLSAWRSIKADHKLELHDKILPNNPKLLPQVKHLGTRLNYLLDELKKRCKEPLKLKIKLPISKDRQKSLNNTNHNQNTVKSNHNSQINKNKKSSSSQHSNLIEQSDSDSNTSSSSSSSSSSTEHEQNDFDVKREQKVHIKREETYHGKHERNIHSKNEKYIKREQNVQINDSIDGDDDDDDDDDDEDNDEEDEIKSSTSSSSSSIYEDNKKESFSREDVLEKPIEDEFYRCSGDMFSNCKKNMKSLKEDLSKIQQVLMSDNNDKTGAFVNIKSVGDHIETLLNHFEPNLQPTYFRYFWNFVVIFCPGYKATTLYDLYKKSKSHSGNHKRHKKIM